MGGKYVSDFSFPSDFGFTGSSKGMDNARSHPRVKGDEYPDGDGTFVSKMAKGGKAKCMAKGGRVKKMADGGSATAVRGEETRDNRGNLVSRTGKFDPAMAPSDNVTMPIGAFPRKPPDPPVLNSRGKLEIDPRTAAAAIKNATKLGAMVGAKSAGQPQAPDAPVPDGQALPNNGFAKGGFIKKAISHPGRMQAYAKRLGVSTHEAMVKASHSKNPSMRGAGALGLRLTKGDLSHGKKKG